MHVHRTMEKHMAYHNGAAYAQWSNKLPHGQEGQSRQQLGSEFLVRFKCMAAFWDERMLWGKKLLFL